ncbi:MAG: assimilatory nitrite reductase large subunit [Bermanella sp.]|jgi:nitrite reductase (NADH) large subunit|nr:assimilatory nitrite reductase large subunit [Bermanella sp.]
MTAKLVMIGNGMAGAKLLDELTRTQHRYDITVFGNEPYGNYNRIMLSPLLAGEKTLNEIMIHDRSWYEDNGITLHAGYDEAIVKIDRIKKCVITKNGEVTPYDRLVIATGSNPFMLPIDGAYLEGVMSFRDIHDVENMIRLASQHKKAVVIGAGLLGLEAAMGLCNRGMDVTVVHNSDIPLNRQLDQEAGKLLKQALETKGLHFKMQASTQSIKGNGRVEKVCFADGSELEADLVIMAIGIRPNIQLAQDCGLYCQNGIVVSDTLQTYDPSIYALGECIEHRGETFGLVAPLYDQATVLANHLSEHGVAQFQTLPTATKLKVTGINLFSVGNFLGTPESEYLYYRHSQQGIYKKIVIENNKIIGVVLYGDTQEGPFYHELLDAQTDIQSIRPYLMFGKALCQAQNNAMNQRAKHSEVAA